MKLAQITKILDLQPIPDADRIERAKVLGFDCVVQKGLHKIGDNIIFVAPDTIAPKSFVDSSYEGDEKIRIKTIKLRGQYSAGLILPISELFKVVDAATYEIVEGADVAEHLKIEKYEHPQSFNVGGMVKGNFPTFAISKTDEDNYRSVPEAIDELKEERFHNQGLIGTLKIHGTSATFLINPVTNEFECCSRNLNLKETEGNVHWHIAQKYNIEKALRSYAAPLAIQGEIYGLGINGNLTDSKEKLFKCFAAKRLDNENSGYFSFEALSDFCFDHFIPIVDVVLSRELGANGITSEELEYIQTFVDNLKYDSGKLAEGMVLRTEEPIYSNVLGKPWSIKIMSQPYDSKLK